MIFSVAEGNTSSSLSDIVSKLQYEKICNPTTTYGNQMTSYGYHGNHTTTEGNQINRYQSIRESNHATNAGYQVTIDGNQATSECKQENTIGNAAALRTSMATTTLTHGVIIDNATPENNACDESNGYLDGETLHVSLKGKIIPFLNNENEPYAGKQGLLHVCNVSSLISLCSPHGLIR
ncbi:hypothetical protein DPMN_184799 [Dreissena polymorpha]|uniref:Uncharacterized protein n=1 Tax=Dreissena polymorpha TaxID=45954 RepID=A0A9D4DME2_DREPO|nr:hypothetical protein DPMN_184764 [Dreissena polymorpha]KAH3750279.1 hypothetical protein DPMN_184799 [Dreissena polymorpha]